MRNRQLASVQFSAPALGMDIHFQGDPWADHGDNAGSGEDPKSEAGWNDWDNRGPQPKGSVKRKPMKRKRSDKKRKRPKTESERAACGLTRRSGGGDNKPRAHIVSPAFVLSTTLAMIGSFWANRGLESVWKLENTVTEETGLVVEAT